MSTTIESLELKIESNSESAVRGIEALSESLKKLKGMTAGKLGLSAIANEIASFTKVDVTGVNAKTEQLKKAIEALTNLPKANISSYINPLKKLPTVLTELDKVDMGAFATKMQEVADAMKPLGEEMEKVSRGFSALPAKIQKFLTENDKISSSNTKAAFTFTDVYHGIKTIVNGLTKVGKKMYSFIEKSMDYTENVNLFTVSMGQYADKAMEYAENVSELMGIDTSEWIRSQGVFMTMATGFGVASDRAYTMSQNLTQLGYDLASFYNIDTETAMQKLKSGLAGELEPLRAIGYDLSQAKLEATALELGIEKSVSAMTQAEKSQLRYYAIMNQVTVAQGDMARTLDDPANQMRVFKAELNMAAREIGNVFIPALNAILPIAISVTKVVGALASVIAGLGGSQSDGAEKSTSVVVENTDAMLSNIEGAQEEAKKLKSNLLGIDELNVFNANEDASTDTSSMFEFELPDYSKQFTEGLADTHIAPIVEKMTEWLGLTKDITSWSDLMRTNFGNILVVVGLIAVALTTWKVVDTVSTLLKDSDKLKGMFGSLTIALKAMGVAAVAAVAAAGAVWLFENTEDTMTKIGAVLSAGALVVGAILAFTGNLPLGLALMGIGAVTMGSAIAMNTDALSDDIKGVIAVITSVVSLALLAVGAILLFTGVSIPLGLALMIGGAVTLATVVAPNWNYLVDALSGPIGLIVAIVSSALLALGIILVATGVGIPIGIALIAAGAIGLVTTAIVNWDTTVQILKTVFSSILAIISGAMMVIGVLLLLTGVSLPLGIALIAAGIAGSVGASKIDDNPVTRFVKKMANSILGVVNWVIEKINEMFHIQFDGLTIGGVEIIPAFNKKLLNIPKIPLLAEGGFLDHGQMFIAREAGAEMVGSIGRRTAVANNDQIVAGIAGGVAEANEEQNTLLREQNSLLRALLEKDFATYIDGKKVTESVEKHQRERGRVLITGGVI